MKYKIVKSVDFYNWLIDENSLYVLVNCEQSDNEYVIVEGSKEFCEDYLETLKEK